MDKQPLKTKWVFVIVCLMLIVYNLRNYDTSTLDNLNLSDIVPLLVLLLVIVLVKTSVLTGVLIFIRKIFKSCKNRAFLFGK